MDLRLGTRVAMVACISVIGCGGGDGGADEGPKDVEEVAQVVREQSNALAEGNGEKACSYFSPRGRQQMERAARERPELGASSCEQAVDALVEALPARYLEALRDPRVEGVRIRGERATAIVLPPKEVQEAAEKAGNAEQLGNRVPLRLIDGEWKIDAIFG